MPLLSGKGNKFKVDPPKIRIEKVTIERPVAPKPKPKSAPRPSLSSSARSSPIRRLSPKAPSASIASTASSRAKSSSPYPSSADDRRLDLQRKRKATTSASQRRSPASDRIEFDKDSDAEDDGWMDLDSHKRQRKGTSDSKSVDSNRKLRSARAYERKDERLQFIHAVDVASLEHKCVPIMGASKEDVAIELQYPTLQRREK
jgi:H3 lysine-79-specific histone-lysine N-methyltransferase